MKKIFILPFLFLLFSCGSTNENALKNFQTGSILENIYKEQSKIHRIKTNFPVLDIFTRETMPLPNNYGFSGNILISDNLDRIALLPEYGDAKLANNFIKKNFDLFPQIFDSDDEFYGVHFANYIQKQYAAQIAYHIDTQPGSDAVIYVNVHFPAFFTLNN